MSIEMSKKYVSRSGEAVRVLCTDFEGGPQPVIAVVDGEPWCFTADGYYLGSEEEHDYDLIEVKDEPMFEVGGIYQTCGGDNARVICVDADCEDYPVVAIVNGDPLTFTRAGKYYADRTGNHGKDLQIPAQPYAHLKMDDLVWVREEMDGDWIPRYFSSLDQEGRVRTFPGGTTSVTTPACSAPRGWSFCWPHANKPK